MQMELNSKDCRIMGVREGMRHSIMDFMKKNFTYINLTLQSMGAAKHLRWGRCTCCKAESWVLKSIPWLHRATGKEFHLAPHSQIFIMQRLTPMSIPPKYPTLRSLMDNGQNSIQYE